MQDPQSYRRKQVRVDVPLSIFAELSRFSDETGLSKNVLVRQSIMLFSRILEAERHGQKLALVDEGHRVLHEIIVS